MDFILFYCKLYLREKVDGKPTLICFGKAGKDIFFRILLIFSRIKVSPSTK